MERVILPGRGYAAAVVAILILCPVWLTLAGTPAPGGGPGRLFTTFRHGWPLPFLDRIVLTESDPTGRWLFYQPVRSSLSVGNLLADLALQIAVIVAASRAIVPVVRRVSIDLGTRHLLAIIAWIATGLGLLASAERLRQGDGLVDSPHSYLFVDAAVVVDQAIGTIWYLAIGCAWITAFDLLFGRGTHRSQVESSSRSDPA